MKKKIYSNFDVISQSQCKGTVISGSFQKLSHILCRVVATVWGICDKGAS